MTHRALVVVDVQNEYETGVLPIAHPPLDTTLAAIGRAIDAAIAHDIPVVTVQHDSPAGGPAFAVGSDGWRLHPTVASRPSSHHLHKTMPSAFARTNLDGWLRAHDVDRLTVVGFMTQHCVASTARDAHHLGYGVEVLSDATGTVAYRNAVGTITAEAQHEAQLVALQAGFAAVATTDEWIRAVVSGATLPADNPVTSALAALTGAR